MPPGKPATAEVTRKRTTAVHHTGRTSGRRYVTPVWAERVGRSVFIQLPYGTDVDWCRNVLAGGGCSLEHHGVRYHATAPTIVPATDVRPHLPPFPRTMQRLIGARSYLRLDIDPEGSAPVPADSPSLRSEAEDARTAVGSERTIGSTGGNGDREGVKSRG